MWPIAKKILKDSSTSETRIALMNLILLHNPPLDKDSEDFRYIKEMVQNLISSPITRNEGYLLLDAVTISNPSVYMHNWGPIIISSLKNPDNSVAKHLSLRLLKRFVCNFSVHTSLHEVFQRFIPEMISMLLTSPNSDEEATNSCNALAICMQYIPIVLAPFSDEIESFLMQHIGSVDFKTEEGVADCVAALPVCLESKIKPKVSYADVWLGVYLKVVNTLQALLNDFLKNSTDSVVEVEGLPSFPTPRLEEEKDEYTCIFKRIKMFSTMCKCLSKMMSVHADANIENTKIQVPVPDLLECLKRILFVHEHLKRKDSNENPLMNLTYPIMQISALSVLESVVLNFTIMEQSGNINTFLNKVIATTVSKTPEASEWYVRSSTWKVVDAWLKHYGSKSSYDFVNNEFLIAELLKDIDITPDKGNMPSEANRIENFESGDVREECCKEALNVLCSMFIFGGAFMDKDVVDEISRAVLKVSCKIQQSLHPAKKFDYPYAYDKCRCNLYKCLLQASLCNPMQTKYVKHAINIFRFGSKDPYLEVKSVCFSALNIFRFYLNPKKPLPDTLAVGDAKVQPAAVQSTETAWESGFNWNESSQERSEDISPPCQVQTVYHNSVVTETQRDSQSVQSSPPVHYADGLETQCNGSSQLPSQQPSHSNVNSESEDIREYSVEEAEMVGDSSTVHAPIIETLRPESRPHLVELKPAQVSDNGTNHQEDASEGQDFPEDAEGESPQRMAENGVYAESEDEENSEEEDEEGSDEEEENIEGYAPQYAVSRYSPISEENEPSGHHGEYYPERKRQRMNNEEEQSSGEEYEPTRTTKLHHQELAQEEESEDAHHPTVHMVASPSSPTVAEMCQDFVLAEPEEIR